MASIRTHRIPAIARIPYVPKARAQSRRDGFLQKVVYAIKDCGTFEGRPAVDVLAQRLSADPLRANEALGPQRILVPVPCSSVTPPSQAGWSSWPAYQLAKALVASGFGSSVAPVLRRHAAVKKSHTAKSLAQRTMIEEHEKSLRVVGTLPVGEVTLIDDVLTTGTQIAAAYLALRIADYTGDIRAFCAGYTTQESRPERDSAQDLRCIIEWHDGNTHAKRRDE